LSSKSRRSEGGDKSAILSEEHRNWNQNIWTKNELVLEFQRSCVCIPVDGHRIGEKNPRSNALSPRLCGRKVLNFINENHAQNMIETQKVLKTNPCMYLEWK
jgi:hypothetical protein